MKCLNRYIELFEALKQPYAMMGDTLYYQNARVIRPWGPACARYPLTREQGLFLCRRLRGRLVISTSGFNESVSQNWYAVICDKFQRLEDLKAKHRSEINRGLRNCQVQQVDADYIARNGFGVFSKAVKDYSNYLDPPETEDQFRARHLSHGPFPDIVHYWGTFHEGRLIGYAQNMLFDPVEANYWIIRLDPTFLSLYGGYALVHRMNEFYLQTHSFEYVNDGWRSLLHETQIQKFLVRKFGFRKARTPITVVYSPAVSMLVRLCYPWRNLAGKLDLRLAGLCNLEAILRGEDDDDPPAQPATDGADKNQIPPETPGS